LDLRGRKLTVYRPPPLGVFLLSGPAGIGKRHLACGFGNVLYSTPRHFEADLRDYAEEHSATVLLFGDASTEGYLTSAVRRSPHHVIVLDHIEHLPAVAAGRLTESLKAGGCADNKTGNWISFQDCLFFLITTRGHHALREIKEPPMTQAWKEKAADLLAVETELPKALFQRCTEIFSMAPLDARGRAGVVLVAMRQMCRHYRMELDWVDPEILAREAAAVNRAEGMEAITHRVDQLLTQPLVEAARTGQTKLRLTVDLLDEYRHKEEAKLDVNHRSA
jgi:ATP-dependent Clp protease ATP-binding subunit ClpA